MGGCVSKPGKWVTVGTGEHWKEERSGQGMTEQSKNRRRQGKVIKDRTVEGEAAEERGGEERLAEWRTETGLDRTGWERTGLSHHYGNREQRRAAQPHWLTQMHFQWNMECHSTPQGEDYQSKVRKSTLHFICLWISFRPRVQKVILSTATCQNAGVDFVAHSTFSQNGSFVKPCTS